MDQAMHSEFQDVTRDIDLRHDISFRTNIYLSSGLLNTEVRPHLPQYWRSKWAAMKTPAPHSSAGHSRRRRLILPLILLDSLLQETGWVRSSALSFARRRRKT